MTPSTTHSVYAKCVSFTRSLCTRAPVRIESAYTSNERQWTQAAGTADTYYNCTGSQQMSKWPQVHAIEREAAAPHASYSFVIFSKSKSIIKLTSIFHCEFAANHPSDCWSIHSICHAQMADCHLQLNINCKYAQCVWCDVYNIDTWASKVWRSDPQRDACGTMQCELRTRTDAMPVLVKKVCVRRRLSTVGRIADIGKRQGTNAHTWIPIPNIK